MSIFKSILKHKPLIYLATSVVICSCGGDNGNPTTDDDSTPDTISVSPVLANPSEIIQGSFTVNGINVAIPISISAGEYAIGQGDFTSDNSSVQNGQEIRYRIKASAGLGETLTTTFEIGESTVDVTIKTKSELDPPEITIVFPANDESDTYEGSISIMGYSEDQSGTSSILISDTKATIYWEESLAGMHRSYFISDVQLYPLNSQEYSVHAIDSQNNATENAEHFSLRWKMLLSSNYILSSYNEIFSANNRDLVIFNPETQESTLQENFFDPNLHAFCLDETQNVIYFVSQKNDAYHLKKRELEGGTSQQLADVPFPNETYSDAVEPSFPGMICHEEYIFVLSLGDEVDTGYEISRLLSVNKTEPFEVITRVETGTQSYELWNARQIDATDNYIYTAGYNITEDHHGVYYGTALYRISVHNFNEQYLTNLHPDANSPLFGGGLMVKNDREIFYLANEKMYKLSTEDEVPLKVVREMHTTASQLKLLNSASDELSFIGIDSLTNELLSLSDSDKNILYQLKVGDGPAMHLITNMAIDPEKKEAYTINYYAVDFENSRYDSGLAKIDLETGKKDYLSTSLPFDGYERGRFITLDKEGQRLFIVSLRQVLQYNLLNDEITKLTDDNLNSDTFSLISGIAYRQSDGLLYLMDKRNNKIITINPSTREIRTVSEFGVIGDGDAINADGFINNNLQLSKDEQYAYFVSVDSEKLMKVDLNNGNRSTLTDSCKDDSGEELIKSWPNIREINTSLKDDSILIRTPISIEGEITYNYLSYNMTESSCSFFSENIINARNLHKVSNTYFGSGQHEIYNVNNTSGDLILIAK